MKYNLTDSVFCRLTVIRKSEERSTPKAVFWMCKCECGKICYVKTIHLTSNRTKSCGCYSKEIKTKHGLSKIGETRKLGYNSWDNMIRRCVNINDDRYHDYGGRGITVCNKWKNSFSDFILDMGDRPSPKHSIDRIDVNGNYEPDNCRWATQDQQSRNTRRNRWIEYNGEKKILADWAKDLKVSPCSLLKMIRKSTVEFAFNHFKSGNKRKRKITIPI